MALFKIFQGQKNRLPTTYNAGYCYFTTDEQKLYIDTTSSSSGRMALNAEKADRLKLFNNIGNSNRPVYFDASGLPFMTNPMLPLTAGQNYKLKGPLGLTQGINYGSSLPSSGFDGQLFFLEDNSSALPPGGIAGQVLSKNSSADGDASWRTPNFLSPNGGTLGGAAEFVFPNSGNSNTAGVSYLYRGGFKWSGQTDGVRLFGEETANDQFNLVMDFTDDGSNGLSIRHNSSQKIWIGANGSITATSVRGAVWNDYAEFRSQEETIEPGYCVTSSNNGQVRKTDKKLQACDGIVSDTFGFSIGETEECRTPLAVAGRVLAYCEGSRYDYQAGDTVCAGPDGKVCKMTREEIKEYPDRVIGIVSEIPEYDTWGSGNIKVNGRIWIKIK